MYIERGEGNGTTIISIVGHHVQVLVININENEYKKNKAHIVLARITSAPGHCDKKKEL